MGKLKLPSHDWQFQKTDLESVTEMSSDSTNMEQRTDVEGSTWAGVWRS